MPDRDHTTTTRSGRLLGTRRRRRFGLFSIAVAASALLAVTACESTPTETGAADPGTVGLASSTSTTAIAAGEPTDPGPTVPGATEPGVDTTAAPRPTRPSQPADTVVTGGTAVMQPNGGVPAESVHTVDLDDLTYPASVCADVIDRPPRGGYDLEDGWARSVPEDTDPYAVALRPERSFGDVNRDGDDDVAVVLDCGHESQPVPMGWIYTVDGSGPRPLAQVQLDPDDLPLSDVLDTSLRSVRISGSKVVSEWSVYFDGDALCCPTKAATVTWTWSDGGLTPGTPIVTKAPTGG